jgi:GAF domain-containing protein
MRPDAVTVMGDAVALVANALQVDHVTILELGPGDDRLRLRAGIGWGDGVAGSTIDAMPGGHVAYTLASNEPVVVADMAAERRFEVSPQLLAAGVRSSIAIRIPSGGEGPYGVIGAHDAQPRAFGPREIAVVERVAAVVGAAIANQRRALDIHDGVLQALVVAQYALDAGDSARAAAAIRTAQDHARRLVEELLGETTTEPLPGDLRRR